MKLGGYMLSIKKLNKHYKSKSETIHALKNISLDLANKGFVVILGKSGSGKSTLLNIIGGLDRFETGELFFKDISTKNFNGKDWDIYRNSYVGFVFQEFYLIEEYTVGKNISIALELKGHPKDQIDKKVVDILNQVDLGDYKEKLPNQLSGGQKQRIAIARALVKEPKIILADEPTGNLDSENGRLILDILKKLSKTKLVIMVTHDNDFANEYADRIIELKDGLVIKDYLNNKDYNNDSEFESENLTFQKTSMPFNFALKLALKSIFIKKFRLILMLFLFIVSLTFLGISTSFAFYDVSKASLLTFNKAELNYLIIEQNCYDTSCTNENFSGSLVESYKNKFEDISFVTSYSSGIKITEMTNNSSTKRDFYHKDNFERIIIVDETHSVFELLVGDYPLNNEILITDYMAEMFLYNKVFTDVNDTHDLINKNVTYNQKIVKISGIVKTDYKSYDPIKDDEFKLVNNYFDVNLRSKYQSIFMTQETYENVFYKNRLTTTVDLKNSEGTKNINYFTFGIDRNYYGTIVGRLPESDNDIVVPLSTLFNIFSFNIDPKNVSDEKIQEFLGDIINLRYQIFMDNEYTEGPFEEYTIVGIINDFNVDELDFNMLVTHDKFQEILISSGHKDFIYMDAVLGDNNHENKKFLTYLDEHNLMHNTRYSQDLYHLKYFTNKLSGIFYIISAVFSILSILLIYTYTSISINNKQKEIGILRSIGARGNDIAKIFVTESVIISLFSSSIATILTIFIIKVTNASLTNEFQLKIVLLYVNTISIVVIFLFSFFVMLLSVLIPITRISIMKPINAIKRIK